MKSVYTGLLSFLCLTLTKTNCYVRADYEEDVSLTVYLESGEEKCFFQDVKPEDEVELEYKNVLHPDVDVVINLYNANQERIKPTQDNNLIHEYKETKQGTLKICMASLTSDFQYVWFNMYLYNGKSDKKDRNMLMFFNEDQRSKILAHDSSFDKMTDAVQKVHYPLTRVIKLQSELRLREARHRFTAESNCERVAQWSIFECTVLLFISGFQIYFIRSLFNDKNNLGYRGA